ncbi:MAG: DUF4373 domain-containing protein [Clostridia bacterium]|nr:DUF4373 domain-containing protein [Clostridia bacterium]
MKDVYYFSHDANALSDTKILNMRADYGFEGYGLFWAIVEQLRCEKDYALPLEKKTYRAIKILTNTTIDVEQYINDCINEYQLFESADGFFYSASLKRRMIIKEEKKERRSAAGKKGAEKRWKNDKNEKEDNNAITMPSEDDSNAIAKPSKKMANNSKGKESKGKEKKVNINIKLNYTKLNYIFNLIINNRANEVELSESDFAAFQVLLKRLDIFVEERFANSLPNENLFEFEVIYYALLELSKSSYVVYLNKLSREDLFNKLLKTQEYVR